RGVGRSLSHGLIFSRVETSTKPGAIHVVFTKESIMKSQIVIAALLSALSVPAFAGHAAAQAAKEMVPLADGGTLYIFKDGKMAQESRFGRAVYLNVGASVSTKDGRNIAITSNEVARLGSLLQKEHGG
ncbi:CopK family periplasmic copper-binding protein, partial [Pseudomonas aeruginosa]|nr:CopK family periplasmic copper-binding protein [Pseudomonas aeruginosa]